MNVIVVTCPSNGWDCVVGIYRTDSIEDVKDYFRNNTSWEMDDLVFSQEPLRSIEDIN